ncbi:HU family DNA-binding protein [Microbacterium sp.]|uniref:HU family DNA-binding protein n=1 Tax=Microbacterium sp. TaxID=51671 RepID=UPI003F708940
MSTITGFEPGRVSKREFVQRVARRGSLPLPVTQQVYDAIIEELIELVSKGNKVTLTGFGKFYPQEHKGHRVRFADVDGPSQIDDYTVLKFSATRAVNRSVQVLES